MIATSTTPQSSRQQTRDYIYSTDIQHILTPPTLDFDVLSLDCFDTVIWRKTNKPREIFYALEQKPHFHSLQLTASQRTRAAARAYRLKFAQESTHEIRLADIYAQFTALTTEQQAALCAEELEIEQAFCFAFPPMVDLIRQAQARGLKIIIVSDTYFTEAQLRKLLNHCLPTDVMAAISLVYCSTDHALAKSTGLFNTVLSSLGVPAPRILHIGDHHTADYQSPKKLGLRALHFRHYPAELANILRLQNTASVLTNLCAPGKTIRSPSYHPFRGLLAMHAQEYQQPETLIGHATFGPMLFGFAQFVCNEITRLKTAGKKPKVFFLLRDAYLLYRACETYAGEPVGKLVRIRKFVAVASSFRTSADIDIYLAGIEPQYYNFWVICEQLLIPRELTEKIIQAAHTTPQPDKTFNQLIHQENIMQIIFRQSSAHRARLRRYMEKEMQIEAGDTVVLVDTGYAGVTQEALARTFQADLNAEITALYFISSDHPARPPSKSFLTSNWCEHGLFEQSCTYQEGSVIDYTSDGDPIFDAIRLSSTQYAKAAAIQNECLRFIADAKKFAADSQINIHQDELRNYALATLNRQIFFPTAAEVHYFYGFQHDKDMGEDGSKTMFNLQQGQQKLREQHPPCQLHPYEARTLSMDLALSNLMQRGFELELSADDMSLTIEQLKVVILRGQEQSQTIIQAKRTNDGYYACIIPCLPDASLGILIGENYQCVQIDSIKALNAPGETTAKIIYNEMNQQRDLFTCMTRGSLIMITPPPGQTGALLYQLVFRPILRWE